MVQKQPNQVIITTPKGRVVVARRLYDCLEARIKRDELGLLRDYDWWQQLSELINGIQFTSADQHRQAPQ